MSEVGLHNLVTVQEAIGVIDAVAVSPRAETVDLADADGRVLAADVIADRDYPSFDKALMDGYALRAADTAGNSATSGGPQLTCVGEVAAGATRESPLGGGECVAIMTGAPLPAGADAVVPIEHTARVGDVVTLNNGPLKPGAAVSPRAADAPAGRVLLMAGTRLGPAQLAVCAQVGLSHPTVYARPRVGILSSGDEVIPHTSEPSGSQLRNSNTPMLMSLVSRYGCDAVDLGHVADDPAAIAAAIRTPGLDALLVTGGMSMGVYDYTPRVLIDLGYELAVTKLKVKPGKPFVFARRGNGDWGLGTGEKTNGNSALAQPPVPSPQSAVPPFVFGLPGNPVSAFVCTVRLASRLLLRMGGGAFEPEWTLARLADALPANGPREFYQPAVAEAGVARVLAWNGSADLFTLARANALLVRMAGESAMAEGAPVVLIRLP